MGSGQRPRKGIRGWSLLQDAGASAGRQSTTTLRGMLDARRGLFVRVGVLGLSLWAAGTLLLGEKGFLHLRALRAQALAMSTENEAIQRQIKDTQFELKEDAGLSMERVMRERYRKALPNEVVYQKKVVAPDSAATPGRRFPE